MVHMEHNIMLTLGLKCFDDWAELKILEGVSRLQSSCNGNKLCFVLSPNLFTNPGLC